MTPLNPVLARKMGLTAAPKSEGADDAQATPMRQMRRALARAADKSVGLSASVLGIATEDFDAEALIEEGPKDWIVLGLRDGSSAGLTGLFMIDPPLRSALVEMQTMGNLLPPAETQRKVTRTDAVMCAPFATQLLRELADLAFGAPDLAPASYDIGPIEDLRTAGLVMVQGQYRQWRITLQVGGGEAQGEILIAMRPKAVAKPVVAAVTTGWRDAMHDAVIDTRSELDAVLCKMALTIRTIDQFEVGQVLQLAGTTVGSVTLIGPGGEDVTRAKLGQIAGKRAVRLQATPVEMEEGPDIKSAPSMGGTSENDEGEIASLPEPVEGPQGDHVLDPQNPHPPMADAV